MAGVLYKLCGPVSARPEQIWNCVGQHRLDQKTIHLPSCFTILSVYKQMVQEHDSLGTPSVGLSQLYSILCYNILRWNVANQHG